jgi:hypothetical protein
MDQAKDVIEAAIELEATESARVARELIAGPGRMAGGDLSPAWQAAVDRRLAKIASGDAAYVSADDNFTDGEAARRR